MSDDTPARSLGGRFTEATHPILERINRSVDIDRRMWRQDLRGSGAHATMLAEVGLLTGDERDAILEGLGAIRDEFESGAFVFLDSDEDIHMAVERRLGERIGAPAAKLHTGRSRNDQVMTDTLLWIRDELSGIRELLAGLVHAFVDQAEGAVEVPMPSFTHLQPAQVSSVAQWLLSHAVEHAGHLRRLDDLTARIDACPLGSGASAGGYLPLDRRITAEALGFAEPALNATAATGSRADLLDAVGLLAQIGVSISRLGEEIVVFMSPAFGFLTLPDRLTTGSSLLPQKRNPDGAELLRGQGKHAAADFAALASVCSGLVSGYAKDLQADKEILFRSWDRTVDLLTLTILHVRALGWDVARLEAACGPQLASLWLADRLVQEGLAFRTAHHLVGRAAREAQAAGSLAEGFAVALEAFDGELPQGGGIVAELRAMTPGALLEGLITEGSAGPASVRAQIARLRERVSA